MGGVILALALVVVFVFFWHTSSKPTEKRGNAYLYSFEVVVRERSCGVEEDLGGESLLHRPSEAACVHSPLQNPIYTRF